MGRFTSDRLAMFAVMTAAFVLMAVAPACAMPECLGVTLHGHMAMDTDMQCDPYMEVDDSPDGIVSVGMPAVAMVSAALPAEDVPVVRWIESEVPRSTHAPPVPPLGERLTV